MLGPWRIALAVLATILGHVNGQGPSPFLVTNLPGLPPQGNSLVMHAGLIENDPAHHGSLFFFHVEAEQSAGRKRTMLIFNGGPGCSSADSLFMENGPFRVEPGGNLRINDGSWHKESNMLFIDQPLGTGLSAVDTNGYLHDLTQMVSSFMIFFDKWLNEFPQYKDNEFWLAGESYAGQYIPYIARALLDRNRGKGKISGEHIDLRGIMINNGWIEPVSMYRSYLPYVVQHGLLTHGSERWQRVDEVLQNCEKAISAGETGINIPSCEAILNQIFDSTVTRDDHDNNLCINVYDMRLRDSYPACGMNWPEDLQHVTPYLRNQAVLQALHATAKQTGWKECSGPVGDAFNPGEAPSSTLIPGIASEIPVILVSGDQDLICNALGQSTWLDQAMWNGERGFVDAHGQIIKPQQWLDNGDVGGVVQSARNITHAIFYNTSHMSPLDMPERSRLLAYGLMGLDKLQLAGAPEDDANSRQRTDPVPAVTPEASPAETPAQRQPAASVSRARKLLQDYQRGAIALAVVLFGILAFVLYRLRFPIARSVQRVGLLFGISAERLGKLSSRGAATTTATRDVELEEGLNRPLFDRNDHDRDDAFSIHDESD